MIDRERVVKGLEAERAAFAERNPRSAAAYQAATCSAASR